jgi:excinuclease ABC subunit A
MAKPVRAAKKPRGKAAVTNTPRTTISVQGARVHNLKNISVDIPRDQLVVVTGLSGSGKSSLAFDTIYAEGQRRYMESLSTYAKRFIAQVEKPDVDFMHGLSPVISIEQKTIGRNPRSTVGTLTDIASYLNLLFATVATATCPRSGEEVPIVTGSQIVEAILELPEGTEFELRAPVSPVYGEELEFVLTEVRKQGCRYMYIDGTLYDLSDKVELDPESKPVMEAVVDRFTITPNVEKQLKVAVGHALLVGDSLMTVAVTGGTTKRTQSAFHKKFGSKTHGFVYGDIVPDYFMFNNPESACRTCGGIGTYKQTHPDLLVSAPHLSIRKGCFLKEAFNYNPNNHRGYTIYTLSQIHGFDLDTPWQDLDEAHQDAVLYGTQGEPLQLQVPPDAKETKENWLRHQWAFPGIASGIERNYRWYRQRDVANSGMEAWLDRVMVDHICPDCEGSRLRHTRQLFTIKGKTVQDFGQMNFDELYPFVKSIKPAGKHAIAGQQVLNEIENRLELLLGIGLDYLNFNRTSASLSGGEAQRIRLSTQIGSGLMGMLYVLDEPSIGLHPKDNIKMISTLKSLRDIGNTVIVVEHDEDTISAADHIIEIGPGPGIHGGEVVEQGNLAKILKNKRSPTGQYLSGAKRIEIPEQRRPSNGNSLTIRGARHNNLKNIEVDIPLGQFISVTGASGSGKSTLINEILYKQLWKELIDTRTIAGDHDGVSGVEEVTRVINIDQAPIGRNSRSNPSTYIGFYDNIRTLFSKTEGSKERDYKPGRFSFNVKGGRCEECQGEGYIRTKLYFMPDVEVLCTSCKGSRFNAKTLEVTHKDKNIAEVLDMPIEEAVAFFADEPTIGNKIKVLDDLGLGYITLGQSATTLSGGEAQRVKLAAELSKLQRKGHVLYILDEPTTGLHLADISKLLDCLHQLVDAGHTVLVIEHHLDVIKTSDHVIDLGPEGGRGGGEIVVTGTPEEVAACKRSHTGRFLKAHL